MLGIDPGKSTGIALGIYSRDVPYTRIKYWQIEGGTEGFCDWYMEHDGGAVDVIDHLVSMFGEDGGGKKYKAGLEIVCEKFILNPGNTFVADLTPVEIQGSLKAFGNEIAWQNRTDKALVKDDVLKRNSIWLTGKMVGCNDARDANDATIHSLVYMLRKRHKPTIREYFADELEEYEE